MAEPTEQEIEVARSYYQRFWLDGEKHAFSGNTMLGTIGTLAVIIADERQARDEHWAKWHEERRDGPWDETAPDELRRAASYVHDAAIAAIRAKGEVK